MIPLRDENPSHSFPYFTIILIVVNVLIYLASYLAGYDGYTRKIFTYGLIPAELLRGQALTSLSAKHFPGAVNDMSIINIPPVITLFTSMFLHGSFWHLLGNMWTLWLFGDNIEDRMGIVKFILFYFITGAIAGLVHSLVSSTSMIPLIGASGAVSGVTGAYIILYPRAKILTLVVLFIFVTFIRIPAFIFLGIWFIGQIFWGFSSFVHQGAGIAFFAHIGGFISGMILVKLLANKRLVQLPRRPLHGENWSAYNRDDDYEDRWY